MDLEFDKKHIWHPYTSMVKPLPCYPVESANGVRIKLQNGPELIDGMSSWWCAIHGYNHPVLNEALVEQSKKMSHVMFGGLTHEPAIGLCKKLVKMTHPELERVFLADSGSVAVEVALKMSIQYFYSLGKKDKKEFLTIKRGYHGDTFGAMSVCDPTNSMHSLYTGYMAINHFAKAPSSGFHDEWDESDIDDFQRILEQNDKSIAGVILEPILQGAGGMKTYHPTFLKKVRALCDKHDVLLILDEIATGFGRTGKLFAYEHADVVPDIMCVGKALTGGYMTLSAVITTAKVAHTLSSGSPGCLMHGPTFMGNPLACHVAEKSLELIEMGEWTTQVPRIEKCLSDHLLPLKKSASHSVRDVRVIGAVGVVEMAENVDVASCQKVFVDMGVWIRPFGPLIYIMPPFVISDKDLLSLIDAIKKVVLKIEKSSL
ncbi:Piso0_003080 [Millerozyma farinosa CBS 7064]|uniref:Piso0_003080 protein n=1 Tax=Pichia sorbitophila (strain ATCC MYA-4447 / BCRC 22081 / CBS 7064 / NBRC 10061 / NRRL Y-12695) TaxID=559304 RepID=G8YKA7_PICSO|nr:Piso0_003080 [Millerozyma farinosa CBS 7064]CCE80752.1 Piso0_003080 [Millerozyma farinosa CBS 7064]